MPFDRIFLDELSARNDIVEIVSQYVQLKKSGANYFGLCPFHNEKTGSFSVSPDKQIFHCFGCGAGGRRHHVRDEGRGTVVPRCGALSGRPGRHTGARAGRGGAPRRAAPRPPVCPVQGRRTVLLRYAVEAGKPRAAAVFHRPRPVAAHDEPVRSRLCARLVSCTHGRDDGEGVYARRLLDAGLVSRSEKGASTTASETA